MSTSCSSCGGYVGQRNVSTTPDPIFDERCGPCETLASLDAKILETEELLEKLKKDRDATITEMNQVRDPLNQRVPPEIASHIFTLYTSDDNHDNRYDAINISDHPRPLVLASVCKKWREIAFSTPEIWTSLNVYNTGDKWRFPARLAEQWLARSGQLPLNIRILWKDEPDKPVVSAMKPLIKIICGYSNRWSTLDLHIPPKAFVFFKADRVVHAHLEYLRIYCSEGAEPVPFRPADIVLHPKKAKLDRIAPSLVLMDWKSIVDLTIYGCDLTGIFRALRQCPRVERLDGIIEGRGTCHANPITPLILQNLAILDCSFYFTDLFFDLLTLPALRTLLNAEIRVQADMMSLMSMLSRSACSLTELDLCWIPEYRESLDEDDLTNFLYSLPSLTSLRLDFSASANLKNNIFFQRFLESSISPLRTSGSTSRPFLPGLESFHYEGPNNFSWYSVATFYHVHSRSPPNALSDQNLQQSQHQQSQNHHSLRPLHSMSIRTPNAKSDKDLIDRESLLLFLDLPENSMQMELNTDLMEESIKYHHLTVDEAVSSFYSLYPDNYSCGSEH